jgi:hypothetical protein
MFEVMGVDAVVGRTFTLADDVPGGGPDGPVAVISHGFWERRFGGTRDVIGKRINVDGVAFTIVGVTGPRFFGPEVGRSFDVAVPLNTEPIIREWRTNLGSHGSWLQVMFRLAQGQTPEQATAAFRAAQPLIAEETRPINRSPSRRTREIPGEPAHDQAWLDRPGNPRPVREAPVRPDGYRRPHAADRVRQHRQPPAGAGDGTPSRVQRPFALGASAED